MSDLAKGTLKRVPVALISENPWNPNRMTPEMFELEKKSIRDNGYIVPIIVRSMGEDGKHFQIIDGAHRFRAVIDLGEETIRVLDLGPIPDHQAKALTLKLNDIHGESDEELKRQLVADLLGAYTPLELSESLPYEPDYYAQFPEFTGMIDGAREAATAELSLPPTEVEVKKTKKSSYDGLTLVHLLVPNERVKELNGLAKRAMKARDMDVSRFEVSFGELVHTLLLEAAGE